MVVFGGYIIFGVLFIASLMLMMTSPWDFFVHFYKSPIILILVFAGVLYQYEHFHIVKDVCILVEWGLVQLGLKGLAERKKF